MKCKQCNEAYALARKYSPVFEETHINLERPTHESYLKLTNILARTVSLLQCRLQSTPDENTDLRTRKVISKVIVKMTFTKFVSFLHISIHEICKKFTPIVYLSLP